MRILAIAGAVAILAVSGCASMKSTSTGAAPGRAQAPADSGPQSPPPPPGAPPAEENSATAIPPPVNVTPGASPAVNQAGTAAASQRPSIAPAQPSGKPRAPAKQPAPAASAPAAPKPTLNLADLERRLRDTPAIGVFTKLSLKNQVDDLLNAFRDLYRDPNGRPTAELRQRYDLLLLKVLSLLQDGDPPLAAAIAASREAIWSILADPEQFRKI